MRSTSIITVRQRLAAKTPSHSVNLRKTSNTSFLSKKSQTGRRVPAQAKSSSADSRT